MTQESTQESPSMCIFPGEEIFCSHSIVTELALSVKYLHIFIGSEVDEIDMCSPNGLVAHHHFILVSCMKLCRDR